MLASILKCRSIPRCLLKQQLGRFCFCLCFLRNHIWSKPPLASLSQPTNFASRMYTSAGFFIQHQQNCVEHKLFCGLYAVKSTCTIDIRTASLAHWISTIDKLQEILSRAQAKLERFASTKYLCIMKASEVGHRSQTKKWRPCHGSMPLSRTDPA